MTSGPGRDPTNGTPWYGITSNSEIHVSDDELTPATPPMPPASKPRAGARRKVATGATLVGVLLMGGAAGATLFGPLTANAASPTAQPGTATASAQPGTGGATTSGTSTNRPTGPISGPGGNHGFEPNETVSDLSVVAKAIGISEADLQAALDGGQTVAVVAKAHGVAAQTVIDALVADGQSELAAGVTAGRLTQAQADAQKAQVTQRATDQVNGTITGGPMGGPGGFGH